MNTPDIHSSRLVLEAAQRGDSRGWDELFLRHAPRLRAFVALRLGERLGHDVAIEDVVQETFLAASESLADFDPAQSGSLPAWLCRIAVHRILRFSEHHEAAKRRRPEIAVRLTQALERIEAERDGPRTLAEARDDAERLRRAVDELPEDARRCILLRYFEERTLDEIAEALGTSPSSTRRLIARSMRELGKALA